MVAHLANEPAGALDDPASHWLSAEHEKQSNMQYVSKFCAWLDKGDEGEGESGEATQAGLGD